MNLGKVKVIMYYDDNRKKFGDISKHSIEKFAKRHGFDCSITYKTSFGEDGMMFKPKFIRDHLNANDADWIVYVDSDIVFRRDASIEGLFEKPLNISTDSHLCVGFMTLKNIIRIRKFVNIWTDLGISKSLPLHDQGVFKLLYENFQWIEDLVHPIPQTLVSNPRSETIGTIAHHFWSQWNDATGIMQQFINELG